MSRPSIEQVTSETLPEFAGFLHEHLDGQRSVEEWVRALSNNWCSARPNHGMVLRDEGRIVGGIGALYADRVIEGRHRLVCNITSWCVLDAYRKQSMRLAMALLEQPDTVFTDFSPTKVVSSSLQFLKFSTLDDAQFVVPNLPTLPLGAVKLVHGAQALPESLDAEALAILRDHERYPWLRFCALKRQGERDSLIVWKPTQLRGMPAARILHASNASLTTDGLGRLCSHLLLQGQVLTLVERRQVTRKPRLAYLREGFIPKVYRGADARAIDYLYSETVAMDLQ